MRLLSRTILRELVATALLAAFCLMPLRLLWGESDRFLAAGTLPFFRAHLAGAEIKLIPRAGHCPHLEAPAALANAIAELSSYGRR